MKSILHIPFRNCIFLLGLFIHKFKLVTERPIQFIPSKEQNYTMTGASDDGYITVIKALERKLMDESRDKSKIMVENPGDPTQTVTSSWSCIYLLPYKAIYRIFITLLTRFTNI